MGDEMGILLLYTHSRRNIHSMCNNNQFYKEIIIDHTVEKVPCK